MLQADENVGGLPPEVWLFVFSFLDDISLYAVGNVCRRWHHLLRGQVCILEASHSFYIQLPSFKYCIWTLALGVWDL